MIYGMSWPCKTMKRQKSQYFTTKESVLSSVKPSFSFHLPTLLVNLNWFVVLTHKNIIPGQTKQFAGFSLHYAQ